MNLKTIPSPSAGELRGKVSHVAIGFATAPVTPDANGATVPSERRISASAVRHLCGGISDMTLWRWLHNPAMGFPRPTLIGNRRYFREADVIAWLERQSTASDQ